MADRSADINPSAIEEGRVKHTHHHHHHHVSKRMKQMSHARKRKREATKIKDKLPGVLHTDDHDVDKLRKRLIIKNEIIAALAEFVGTFLFLFFAFGIATQAGQQELSQSTGNNASGGGTQNAGKQDPSQLLYSSLGFGFSLAVNAWVFFRISGGLFNPAVTLGLFLCGALTWYRSVILFIVQFIAAIVAAGIAQIVIPGGINAQTKLGSTTTLAQGFFIEMFCTALLMLAIFMLAGEKHKATFLAPVGIGLALFLAELFATGLTGGSLNPARTLGPEVIAASFESSTWIYYTAPFVGTLLSSGIYWLLKASHYETANEGQDGNETEQALVLRDTHGNVTGAVQRVDVSEAPNIPGLKEGQLPNASQLSVNTANVDLSAASHAPSIMTTGPDNDNASLYSPAMGRESFEEKNRSSMMQTDSQVSAEKEREKDQEPGLDSHDFMSDEKNKPA